MDLETQNGTMAAEAVEQLPRHHATDATAYIATDAMRRALDALSAGSTVSEAATAARVNRVTLWRWRRDQPAFPAAWQDAEERGTDWPEEALYICAQQARTDPRYQPSLHLALKARRPQQYREGLRVEDGGLVSVNITVHTVGAQPSGAGE